MSQAEPAAPRGRSFDSWTIVLGLFGLGNLANGFWMLADPVHWFYTLPAGVPDFGPLNEHFVRDIGCIFTLMGAGLMGAAVWPSWRVAATAAAAGFSLLHALVHVIDTTRGPHRAEQTQRKTQATLGVSLPRDANELLLETLRAACNQVSFSRETASRSIGEFAGVQEVGRATTKGACRSSEPIQ